MIPSLRASSCPAFYLPLRWGIFLNRRNVCAVDVNEAHAARRAFQFRRRFHVFRWDIGGEIQCFVILTVAAAEAAIGLAILVVRFRERSSLDVEIRSPRAKMARRHIFTIVWRR